VLDTHIKPVDALPHFYARHFVEWVCGIAGLVLWLSWLQAFPGMMGKTTP